MHIELTVIPRSEDEMSEDQRRLADRMDEILAEGVVTNE